MASRPGVAAVGYTPLDVDFLTAELPIFAFFPDAFGPGPKPPKAVVVGRAASKRGVRFSAPLATKFGSGPEAVAKGRAAGPKLCFPAPVCSDFYVFLRAAW